MPHLDVRTASIATMVVLLLMAGAMVLVWRTNPDDHSARYWAGGKGLIGLGVMFIGLRGGIPVFLSIPLANVLIVLGAMMLLGGIRVFHDKPVQWGVMAVIGGGTLLLFVYYTYVQPDVVVRITFVSLSIAGVCGLIVWQLARDFDPRMRLQQGLVMACFALYCLFMVVRAGLLLGGPPVEAIMGSSAPIHSLVFLFGMIVSIGITFGFSAMINRRLHLHLDYLASYDLLTGIYNRRAFEEAVARELARSQRHHTQLAVLMLDLDHFKQINDRYGHTTGDCVLRQTAHSIKAVLRMEDTLARIGGEEFCVLLPQTDMEEAITIAERVRRAIAEQTTTDHDGRHLRVTSSIGIAAVDAQTGDWETIFQHADQALYRAKQGGRNQVAA